jgi:hypothetical protein
MVPPGTSNSDLILHPTQSDPTGALQPEPKPIDTKLKDVH